MPKAIHRRRKDGTIETRLLLTPEEKQRLADAALREEPEMSLQGLGTGFHWSHPKTQRARPKGCNNPQGRRAHRSTEKRERKADILRTYGALDRA